MERSGIKQYSKMVIVEYRWWEYRYYMLEKVHNKTLEKYSIKANDHIDTL